jgi:hypothetical protein
MSARLADPAVAIQEWMVAALTGSQELADALALELADVPQRVWDSVPSTDADLPYIILTVSTPVDVGAVPMVEVMARSEATALVVGQVESYDAINPVAIAVHHALQGQINIPLSGGGTMLSSRRLRAVAYPEQTNGVEYRHLGGTYEVYVQ